MSEAKTSAAQEKMQKFGRFLSAMVMPNIGAFIAWGRCADVQMVNSAAHRLQRR